METIKKKKEKPKYNMFQNSWFMIKLAFKSKEKKVLFLGGAIVILSVLINLINLYVSPLILSVVEKNEAISELIKIIITFVLSLGLTSALLAYVNENILYGRVSVRIEIINSLNNKAATTSYSNIFEDKFSKLLSKASQYCSGNSEATEAVWTTLTNLSTNILGFIVYLLLLSNVYALLIVVIIVTTTISYFISNYCSGYRYRHKEEESEYTKHMSYINYKVQEFKVMKDIKIFGLRPWIVELYDKSVKCFDAFQRKAQNVYIIASIFDLIMAFLRNGIAYYYLINLVLEKNLGVSEFLLYFSAVSGFSSWITGLLSEFNTLYKQSLDLSIVREVLDYSEPFKFEDGKHLEWSKDESYEIKLENVSYCYPNNKKNTIDGINLTLHKNEKLAIVGLNGAGKTTLVKLICGFLNPTEGRVLLNGEDIRNYNRKEYYEMFSAVFQTFSVLAGSIATNIAQSEENIDYELVDKCLDKAGLLKKVSSLKEGVNSKLERSVYEEAVNLSGGEMQRLMLARSLYRDSPFIILDEPTAALDPIAEADLYQKYNEMTENKASVYISHRLASTRFCDRIIMLNNGKICEEGTHYELMKNKGEYYNLFEVQSKYYKEGAENNEE